MSKTAIIFDGNFMAMRSLFAVPDQRKNSILLEDDYSDFLKKLAIDVAKQIKTFSDVANIIIWTVDSKSWRKNYDENYKANRGANSGHPVNWDNFQAAMSEFTKILESKGVIISKIDGIEGDDLIYAWQGALRLKDINSVIITSDRDLCQLVSDENGIYTTVFSPITDVKKLYVPINFDTQEELESRPVESFPDDPFAMFDKFDMSAATDYKKFVKEILLKPSNKTTTVPIDPERVRFIKTMFGDTSDNVMPVYETTYKTGKPKRVTENKAGQVYDDIKEINKDYNCIMLYDPEFMKTAAMHIITKMGDAPNEDKVNEVVERAIHNAHLTVLNKESYPKDIYDSLIKYVDEKFNETKNSVNIYDLSKVEKMLAGTKYAVDIKSDAFSIRAGAFKGTKSDDLSFIQG